VTSPLVSFFLYAEQPEWCLREKLVGMVTGEKHGPDGGVARGRAEKSIAAGGEREQELPTRPVRNEGQKLTLLKWGGFFYNIATWQRMKRMALSVATRHACRRP
jgi:hypothetical protein